MKLYLFLLLFFTSISFAKVSLRPGGFKAKQKEESSSFHFGDSYFEVGVNYATFKEKRVHDAYEHLYRVSNLYMPSIRWTQFITLSQYFYLGYGGQISYFRKNLPTTDDNDVTLNTEQTLVYLPYQIFSDFKVVLNKIFAIDLWLGYKESFIENRRDVEEGEAYISRKGKHWNSFYTVGGGPSFSIKKLGNPSFFSSKYPFGVDDIFMKIFYETDFSLDREALLGDRRVLKNVNYAQRTIGLAFLFKL